MPGTVFAGAPGQEGNLEDSGTGKMLMGEEQVPTGEAGSEGPLRQQREEKPQDQWGKLCEGVSGGCRETAVGRRGWGHLCGQDLHARGTELHVHLPQWQMHTQPDVCQTRTQCRMPKPTNHGGF